MYILIAKITLLSLVVILVIKFIIIGVVVDQLYGGNIDNFLYVMRSKPIQLAFFFLALYIIGSVFLFPVSLLITTMGYAYTHIWGPLYGLIFVLVWNYLCASIAYSFVFLCARYFFGDFVYSRVIQNRKFF